MVTIRLNAKCESLNGSSHQMWKVDMWRNDNHHLTYFCLPVCLFLFQGTLQEVIAWGLLGWKLYANVNGPIQCKALSSLGVSQIVCSEKGFLILSSSGAVYTQNYKSTTLVSSVAQVVSVYWWTLSNELALFSKQVADPFVSVSPEVSESFCFRLLCWSMVWTPERLWS